MKPQTSCLIIGHFWVPPGLCFKTRVGAQPLIWKSFFILTQIKLIFTRKVVYLASFWKWGFLELVSGLLTRNRPQFSLDNPHLNHGNDVKCPNIYLWGHWDNSVNWRYSHTCITRPPFVMCSLNKVPKNTFHNYCQNHGPNKSFFIGERMKDGIFFFHTHFLLSSPILNGHFVEMYLNYNVPFTIQSNFRRIYVESSEHKVAPTGWSFGKGAFLSCSFWIC